MPNLTFSLLTLQLLLLLCFWWTLNASRHGARLYAISKIDAIEEETKRAHVALRTVSLATAALSRYAREELPQRGALAVESARLLKETTRHIQSSTDRIRGIADGFPAEIQRRKLQKANTERPHDINIGQGAPFEPEAPDEPVSEFPGGPYRHPSDPLDDTDAEERNSRRRDRVKAAFQHSWRGYTQYAFGMDELQPRSRTGKNWNEMDGAANGLGLTILDSMTTMHLMGLRTEVHEALRFVDEQLNFDKEIDASTFEASIRILGALLSMYELTGETNARLLERAVDIADRLLVAFNTTTGIPHSTVSLRSRRHFSQPWANNNAVLSEFGTLQLEFRTLSYHTKNPIYDMKATHMVAILEARAPKDWLCPVFMSIRSATWSSDHVSLGALGDSFYEYLLKQYLLTGKTEERYRAAFERLVRGIVEKLVFVSIPSRMYYVAEFRRQEYFHKMDHLACFVGGMLAMGAIEVRMQLNRDRACSPRGTALQKHASKCTRDRNQASVRSL